jgi:hypothetical protein
VIVKAPADEVKSGLEISRISRMYEITDIRMMQVSKIFSIRACRAEVIRTARHRELSTIRNPTGLQIMPDHAWESKAGGT